MGRGMSGLEPEVKREKFREVFSSELKRLK